MKGPYRTNLLRASSKYQAIHDFTLTLVKFKIIDTIYRSEMNAHYYVALNPF